MTEHASSSSANVLRNLDGLLPDLEAFYTCLATSTSTS